MTSAASRLPDPETAQDPEPNPLKVREKAGLTPAEMAVILGMSEFGYAAWERGHRRPGGPAFQLLRLLDSDPDRIAKALAP